MTPDSFATLLKWWRERSKSFVMQAGNPAKLELNDCIKQLAPLVAANEAKLGNLNMLVRRLVQRVRKYNASDPVASSAVDYLIRQDLGGNILRVEKEETANEAKWQRVRELRDKIDKSGWTLGPHGISMELTALLGDQGSEVSELEKATLKLLEDLNTRYVCTTCENRGGEGKHKEDCEF